MKIYKLSEFHGKSFSKATNKIYNITDFNNKQYPHYINWFYQKNIPRVLDGTGDVLFSMEDFRIKGLLIFKNTKDEKKICTLFVDEPYRHKKICTELIEHSFEILGTSKPVITIPKHKIEQFKRIIAKYNWKESKKIYDYNKLEICFNKTVNN